MTYCILVGQSPAVHDLEGEVDFLAHQLVRRVHKHIVLLSVLSTLAVAGSHLNLRLESFAEISEEKE